VSPLTAVKPVLSLAPQAASPRDRLHEAAQSFEAIFVRQMLEAANAASFGDELFGSQAAQTFKSMQTEQFAAITAKSGTLGFAAIIEAQMAKALPIERTSTNSARAGEKTNLNSAQPELVEGPSAKTAKAK